MNSRTFHSSLMPMLLACLGLMLAPVAPAQTFTLLHTLNISDGESPDGLVLSGNILYGTGLNGGTNGNGTVFKLNTDGTGFTNLYTFSAGSDKLIGSNEVLTNRDGENPGRLLLSGNTLYGAATKGGTNGSGTVFRVNTDGTGFTNLYNFSILTNKTNLDGASPDGGALTILNNTLYGTALLGGANANGTVFKINTDGTGFTNLYTFSASTRYLDGSMPYYVNNDGALPNGPLTLSGDTLYGTTTSGGGSGAGVLFKVNTDGSGFTNFYSFTGGYDGSLPVGLLLLSGNTLYGATLNGGTNGNGTVFKINTDGTGFANLYAFSAGKGTAPYITNSNGANPSLEILTNNTLYGRAGFGTSSGDGTVFAINTDGTGFTNLYNFTALSVPFTGINRDGADPGGLIFSSNMLYGVAEEGGTNGDGTLFALTVPLPPPPPPPPSVAIAIAGNKMVISWPSNLVGYVVESTTNLVSPNWQTITNTPTLVAGNNTITNIWTDKTRFFRLRQSFVVDNLDQTTDGNAGPIGTDSNDNDFLIGQEFILPAGNPSYTLNKITLLLDPINGNGNITVSLWNVGPDNNPTNEIAVVSSQLVTHMGNVDFIPSTNITLQPENYYVVTAPTTPADNALVAWDLTGSTNWTGFGTLGSYAGTPPGSWENFPISDGAFQLSVQATPVPP